MQKMLLILELIIKWDLFNFHLHEHVAYQMSLYQKATILNQPIIYLINFIFSKHTSPVQEAWITLKIWKLKGKSTIIFLELVTKREKAIFWQFLKWIKARFELKLNGQQEQNEKYEFPTIYFSVKNIWWNVWDTIDIDKQFCHVILREKVALCHELA